jgi:site-specific recombinase XerD
MFKKLYQAPSILQKHMDAPLLYEREAYIARMEAKGFSLRYMQIKATYLLYAVCNLSSVDDGIISLESIVVLRDSYEEMKINQMKHRRKKITDDTKANDLACTVIDFFSTINRIDHRITEKDNIFNVLFDLKDARLRYFCSPMYKDRLAYLNHLHSLGMSLSTIREYAETQLHILSFIAKIPTKSISYDEIMDAWRKWDAQCRLTNDHESHKRKKIFLTCAKGWFTFLGILQLDNDSQPEHEKLEDYCRWMYSEKGLAGCTVVSSKREIALFIATLHEYGKQLSSLTLPDIDSYMVYRHNLGCNRRTMGLIATYLRGFIRYAAQSNWIERDLSESIRSPRRYTHEGIPNAPQWTDVEKIAAYYNEISAVSIRNRAIMLLLTAYGLRSSELAGIQLDDIDWAKDVFVVRHIKRGRTQTYPMLPLVGNAIIRYIKNVRNNNCGNRHLFLTLCAPYKGITRGVIYNTVSKAYRQLGINARHIGGHSLRHACATHLINNGETLKSVADILGHRSINSTMAYAKVDLLRLSEVADMNWEGLI